LTCYVCHGNFAIRQKPQQKEISMASEMPGGPIIDLFVRDANIKFPPAYNGTLPPPAAREQLEKQLAEGLAKRNLTPEQTEEAFVFFEEYERAYFEDMETSRCYHRKCGGAAVVQGNTGIFCERCGKLPDLIPPECIRR